MSHPMTDAPPGIVIGAVDPVTGVAFFDLYWAEFPILSIYYAASPMASRSENHNS